MREFLHSGEVAGSRRRSKRLQPVFLAGILACLGGDPSLAGDVVGRVEVGVGVSTELRVVVNRTDPDVCGPTRPVHDLVVSASGGVVGALVWLEGVATLGETPRSMASLQRHASLQRRSLDNVDCEFAPMALTLRVDAPLDLVSSDQTLHTVHWRGPTEENVALPLDGVLVERRLTQPGVYSIRCDVHPWMRAWIRVDDHPYHAATASEGDFRIEDVPVGRYILVVWHERLGRTETEISVPARGTVRMVLALGAENTQP